MVKAAVLAFAAIVAFTGTSNDALALSPGDRIKRRDAIKSIAVISAITPCLSVMATETESVDIAAFKAVQSKTAAPGTSASAFSPTKDPPINLNIRGGIQGKSTIKIPRVGYSFYKTPPEQAARCTALALRAGVRHLDVASLYGSNAEVAQSLKKYLDVGMDGLDFSAEKVEVLDAFDAASKAGYDHSLTTISSGIKSPLLAPPPSGSAGRRGRRESLFISHKLSNSEQSTNGADVRRAVKAQIATLGASYLDMVSIHSPLTDAPTRLATCKFVGLTLFAMIFCF